LHAAFGNGDLAIERSGQPEDQSALELRHHGVGIDGDAGIDHRNDTAHEHFALRIDLGLDYRRDKRLERRLYADAAADARGQRLAPTRFFRRRVHHRKRPWLLAEHAPAEFNGILAGLARQFIHHALDREHIVVWADATPETGRHRRRLGLNELDMEVRDVIGHVHGGIDAVDVDALLERRRQPARQDRGTRDLVFPADDLAAGGRRSNHVAIDRAVVVVLDVFLAGPHHLYRHVHLLGDADGGDDHVGLELAAKAAAEQVVVDDDFLDRQPGGLRGLRLHARGDLRAGPDLAGVRLDMHGGAERL